MRPRGIAAPSSRGAAGVRPEQKSCTFLLAMGGSVPAAALTNLPASPTCNPGREIVLLTALFVELCEVFQVVKRFGFPSGVRQLESFVLYCWVVFKQQKKQNICMFGVGKIISLLDNSKEGCKIISLLGNSKKKMVGITLLLF